MDTLAHPLNTVNNIFHVKKQDIRDFIKDIQRLGIRHKPFTAYAPEGFYEIELYPNSNSLFLKMKYEVGQ